jgi:hypothetical protein
MVLAVFLEQNQQSENDFQTVLTTKHVWVSFLKENLHAEARGIE